MAGQAERIMIEVRVDSDEISGHACSSVSERKPFTGWLGLIWVLDGLFGISRASDEKPVARVCVAFASAEHAEEFAASVKLREAILETGAERRPEIWFTHPLQDRSEP
jgi:hypothetical protein